MPDRYEDKSSRPDPEPEEGQGDLVSTEAPRTRPRSRTDTGGQAGLAIDSSGGPVVDPTENVRELVTAETTRQDDLRRMESQHIHQLMALERSHSRELRKIEHGRLDAIRDVDQGTVQRTALVQADQQTALARQVTEVAETLRKQVETTAQAADTKNDAKFTQLTTQIAALQEAQFRTAGGKEQIVETREVSSNRGMIIGLAITGVVMVFGFLSLIATIVGMYLTFHK